MIKVPQKKLNKKISVVENDSISSIIKNLGFDIHTIVVLYNNKPIPETTKITEDIDLTVIKITSKG